MRFFLPLGMLLAIGGLFWYGLGLQPSLVPSPLIDQPAPAFDAPLLEDPERTFTHSDLRGRTTMVHVWATWCVTCRAEHPTLMDFARRDLVRVVGLNHRDDRASALRWLAALGNPYELNVFDPTGRVGIEWGVYGTPETFILDRDGVIRFKHVGPLTADIIERRVVPLIERLEGGE